MSRQKRIAKAAWQRLFYERYLMSVSLRQLKRQPPEDFSEMALPALTVAAFV